VPDRVVAETKAPLRPQGRTRLEKTRAEKLEVVGKGRSKDPWNRDDEEFWMMPDIPMGVASTEARHSPCASGRGGGGKPAWWTVVRGLERCESRSRIMREKDYCLETTAPELMFGYSEQEALKMTIWQARSPPNKAARAKGF